MKKGKIFTMCVALGVMISMLFGCNATNKGGKQETSLSDSEKEQIMSQLESYDASSGNNSLSDMENIIYKNIPAFDDSDKDKMVNLYIVQMTKSSSDLNKKLSLLGYELEDVVKSTDKLNLTDTKTYKNISDNNATIRGFLQETNAKGFTIVKDDNTQFYTIKVNEQKVLDKFGKYVSDDLKTYLQFLDMENTDKNFVDTKAKTIDIDEVSKRILAIEDGLKKDMDNNYEQVENWLNASDYYYSILLGINHKYFVSNDYLKDDILEKYKDIISNNKDTQLADILQQVVDIYDGNGKKFDADTQNKIQNVINTTIYTDEIKDKINELNAKNAEKAQKSQNNSNPENSTNQTTDGSTSSNTQN